MGGGVTKVFSKVHKFHRGHSLARKVIGDKNYDKAFPLGTSATKQAAEMDQAEKDARSAEELAAEQRAMQRTELAELDEEENRRIKKLLTGSRGIRAFRGGLMYRSAPSNTAGAGGGASRAPAGGASAAPGASGMRSGGMRGGIGRFRLASQ